MSLEDLAEESGEEDKFEYSGELVFNGIINTSVNHDEPDELRKEILDKLKKFESGTPSSPGSGRLDLELSEYSEEEEIEQNLQETAEEHINIEYQYEDYPPDPIEVVEVNDGEANYREAYPRSLRSVYVYWDYPNTMFLQGAKSRVGDVAPKINSALGANVEFRNHSFDSEFLLWIFHIFDPGYKVEDVSLHTDLSIKKLRACKIEGDEPIFGRDAEIDKSQDVTRSVPVIAGLLKDMDIEMLEGDFEINGYRLNAKIFSTGQVRVYAAKDLNSASDLRRILISNQFLSAIMKEYNQWEDEKPEKSYPHPKYFYQLKQEAAAQDADLDYDLDYLKKKYADLRHEDPDNYDFEDDEE